MIDEEKEDLKARVADAFLKRWPHLERSRRLMLGSPMHMRKFRHNFARLAIPVTISMLDLHRWCMISIEDL
jgi:predicted alpha/beta hydrolase